MLQGYFDDRSVVGQVTLVPAFVLGANGLILATFSRDRGIGSVRRPIPTRIDEESMKLIRVGRCATLPDEADQPLHLDLQGEGTSQLGCLVGDLRLRLFTGRARDIRGSTGNHETDEKYNKHFSNGITHQEFPLILRGERTMGSPRPMRSDLLHG